MRSGFNPQCVPWLALGWPNTLWVLLLAPAAAVPQLKVCKGHLGTAHSWVWAGHKRSLRLSPPNLPPNCPLQGWAPVLSGRSKQGKVALGR